MREEEIIGHGSIREYFSNAIRQGTLSHAHLLVGEDGIGKSLLAKEFGVKLLGKEEIKPYVDINEFKVPKGKKSIGIDEIRNVIEEVGKKPYEGNRKVIIVYEGEKLTIQAQNAFLKTIEEPPKGVYIFILVENSEAILDTIKSRCQIHKLNRLKSAEIERFIKKKYPSLSNEERETLLAWCNGIPGKCERFIENEDFKNIRNTTAALLMDINKVKEAQFLSYSNFFLKYREISDEVLDSMLSYIRDTVVYKDTGNNNFIINKDKTECIKEFTGQFSYNKLEQMVNAINLARSNLSSNVNPALTFDVMLMSIFSS